MMARSQGLPPLRGPMRSASKSGLKRRMTIAVAVLQASITTISAQIAALVVSALGYALAVWATASNAFFSQVVRIQSERGHSVATGGPYRYVRHPAYLGAILYELAVPVLLASWWALIVGGLNVDFG